MGPEEKNAMSENVDFSKVTPASHLRGDSDEDTALLHSMLKEAEGYLCSFEWCQSIIDSYFGIGVGGVVAVFLFRIEPVGEGIDDWIWAVVGDLPPAYITTDEAPNPACALDGYIGAMQAWVDAVERGLTVAELIPVDVSPTSENAAKLKTRLEFLDKKILSEYASDLKDY